MTRMAGYRERLLSSAIAGTIPFERGRVTYTNVQHDGWCKLLAKKGDCNCNPIITHTILPRQDEVN